MKQKIRYAKNLKCNSIQKTHFDKMFGIVNKKNQEI